MTTVMPNTIPTQPPLTLTEAELNAKIDAAKMKIYKDERYKMMSAWVMHLECVVDMTGEILKYPTAGTDGKRIIFNAWFLEKLSISDLVTIIMHETGHCFLYHTAGRGKLMRERYGHDIANRGMDYAVNELLVKCGASHLHDWLHDEKYYDMSAEEICEILKEENKPQPPGDDPDGDGGSGDDGGESTPSDDDGEGTPTGSSGTGGGHELMDDMTPEEQKEAQQLSDTAMADASIMEAMKDEIEGKENRGQGRGGVGGLIDKARNARHKPKSWREELEEFMGMAMNDEFISTYTRPNLRPVPGIFRPGRRQGESCRIGVVIDTSGSMYSDLPKIMVELEAMSQDGFGFDVICSDGNIYGPYSFDEGEFDYRELPLKGGGGSDMHTPFKKFIELDLDVDAMVFCTDGCIRWPEPETLAELPPCLLVEFSYHKSNEGEHFYKHILIKDDD